MYKAMPLSFLFFLTSTALFCQTKQSPRKTFSPQQLSSSITRGKTLYVKYCLTCHQSDGGGVPNMNPPLIQSSYVSGDKYILIKILLNGFSERIDIEGESYSNNMPAQNFLKDNQIADVLNYIRNNFGNKAAPVESAEVTSIRSKLKTDIYNKNGNALIDKN